MGVVEEDGWGVGEEGAVPEAVDAAVEDVDLLAGVKADGGGVGVFAVHEDFVAGLEARLEGNGELLGAEDRIEDAQRDVGALDEDEDHGDEGPVCGLDLAAAAEEPVEQRAEEKSEGGADERAAEKAHGVAAEIEYVAEGEGVEIGIFVEQVEEFEIRGRRVRGEGQRAGDGGDEDSDDEENCGGAAARASDRRPDGSFGFLSHPVAQKEREAWQTGGEIVFLARGEAEEEKDDSGPAKEKQEDGFGGTAYTGDAR